MSLTIMVIIIFNVLYLMYVSNLEYLIINSEINSIQSSYLSEGKIYLVLNKEKYFEKITPSIERFIKNPSLTSIKDIYIALDEDDLSEGDTHKSIWASIFYDYDERIVLELRAKSSYNKIIKEVISKVTILNELYELRKPIISDLTLNEKEKQVFTKYMDFLCQNINIPNLDIGMYGIYIKDFSKVKLINGSNEMIIEYYRNDINNPIKVEYIPTNNIFLLSKDNSKTTEVSFVDLNLLNGFNLSGIIYIEGSLIIENDFVFNGILIVNGNIFINPLAKVTINGITFHKGECEITNNLEAYYDFTEIRKYIIYLPKFIDLSIRSIKVN